MQLAAVRCGERGLHIVDPCSQARAERAEVRHHRPAHEAREALDVVEGFHVQLLGDLGAPRCGELDAGVEEQRASEWLAHLRLRLGAGGTTDGDEAAHGLHLGGEGGIAPTRARPVGRVDRKLTRERDVDLVREERAQRGEQLRAGDEALVQRRVRLRIGALPEAGPAAAHVPVREVVDERADARRSGERVERVERVGDDLHRVGELAEDPPVEQVSRRALVDRCRGPAVEVGVGREEREDVPECEERLTGTFPNAFVRHAARRPRLARGEEVPPQRVGPVRRDHHPRVDHVSFGLRHLLAVLVDEQAEAHDVLERRRIEHERVHSEQRVEPAARLVDRLADEISREGALELLTTRERVVVLRGGHRA